jgi:hypothetical protein
MSHLSLPKSDFTFTVQIGVWRKAKCITLAELNSNASCPFIESIVFKDFNTCIFIFKEGYIL